MPGEAGIPQGRVADCFRCAVKTRGLEKGNAEEAEFFFIWGVFGFLPASSLGTFAKRQGIVLLRSNSLSENQETRQAFS